MNNAITINDLVGIKYGHAQRSLESCDCFGLVSMYYQYILKDNSFPCNDGKKINKLRYRKNDLERIIQGLASINFIEIDTGKYIRGDVIILATEVREGVFTAGLVVAVNRHDILITFGDSKSQIRPIATIKHMIHKAYRKKASE